MNEQMMYDGQVVIVIERRQLSSSVRFEDGTLGTVNNKKLKPIKQPRIPSWQQPSDRIEWSDDTAFFLGQLASRGNIFMDGPNWCHPYNTDRYESIKGKSLETKSGTYGICPDGSIANDERYGTRCIIRVPNRPDTNRIQLGWALLELGFDLGHNHDITSIRANIPVEFQPSFDRGYAE
jgi:hypothetical protein